MTPSRPQPEAVDPAADPGVAPATQRPPAPSLRAQLVLRLVFPLVTVLLLSAVAAYWVARDFADLAYDRSLYDSAQDLSRRVHWLGDRMTVDVPPAALEMLEYDAHDKVYYQVRAPDGSTVVGNADLPGPSSATLGRPVYYYASFRGEDIRLVAVRVPVNPENVQDTALVVVAETLGKRQILANEILAAVALSQALLIALACISVYVGVGHGLEPLERLRRQLGRRSHRDLHPLDEPRTPREVRPLVHAINELMERLGRALSSQQRFLADAAHQLRTPLSGLRTHAELALREPTLDGTRERLRALVTATDRSTHLANQLLALARAEPDAAALHAHTPVDLDALARETTTQLVPLALSHEIDLGYAGSPAQVRGNRLMLGELLSNLIDNAIRYNRKGGHVTVAVATGAGEIVLSVTDDGPGIPPEARERVFERFQRLSEGVPGGCGLGLAIVREIAGAHGADVILDDAPEGRGTRVTVRFPVDAKPAVVPDSR